MTGTRMWRRGADKDGNVANFVETEQVLEAEGFVASYVQVHFLPCLLKVGQMVTGLLFHYLEILLAYPMSACVFLLMLQGFHNSKSTK